jgi:hypothetical protein
MANRRIPDGLRERYREVVASFETRGVDVSSDATVADDTRKWLDGQNDLPWQSSQGITSDEYFFITTLYGNNDPNGQRTLIRKFFEPLFVRGAEGDVRRFNERLDYDGLRAPWMKCRLCKMARILQERDISMKQYVDELRSLERAASVHNPMPALGRIVRDHGATSSKTLSVFVRDCVGGNCFPIDLRVERQLIKYTIPTNERLLVRVCLDLGRNPRHDARLFYEAN